MSGGHSSRPIWLGADHRKWDHCRIHVQLLQDARLSAYDIAVYVGLVAHAEIHTGKCFPAAATLARYINSSEKTVRRSIAVLEEAGYVSLRKQDGKANIYELLPPPTLDSATDLANDPGLSDRGGGLSDRGTLDSATDEQEPITRTNNNEKNEESECPKCDGTEWVQSQDESGVVSAIRCICVAKKRTA